MNLRHELSLMLKELDATDASANDLWSWLPSHAMAKKHHGDYAFEVRPSVAEVMNEAATVFALLRSGRAVNEEERELLGVCPCGEDHEPLRDPQDLIDNLVALLKQEDEVPQLPREVVEAVSAGDRRGAHKALRASREAELAAIPFDKRCWHARGGKHNAGPICALRRAHVGLHQSLHGDEWEHSDDTRPPGPG